MHLIALDIGNSRIKAGLFLGEKLEWVKLLTFTDYIGAYISFWTDKYEIDTLAYTNVNSRQMGRILDPSLLLQIRPIEITGSSPGPVRNAYRSPATLGSDRYAAVVGARLKSEKRPLLVIDIGTAITYDYVDAENNYLGGAIAPGINLRLRSLHHYTSRLPLVKQQDEVDFIGSTTQDCIRAGVQYGVICEIEGMIGRYKKEAGDELEVYLTGGTAIWISDHIEVSHRLEMNLVLEGIYHLAQQHRINAQSN